MADKRQKQGQLYHDGGEPENRVPDRGGTKTFKDYPGDQPDPIS